MAGADLEAGRSPPDRPAAGRRARRGAHPPARRDALASGTTKEAIASCLPGEVAVGGGAVHDGTLSEAVGINYSHPLEADGSTPEDGDRPTQWLVGGNNHFTTGVDYKMTAYVLCANA